MYCTNLHSEQLNIGGVMVSMLTLSAVYCGFEPWLGQTKDYKIDICMNRHVTPLGHIILIPSQPVFALSP
jgi:hypothetical protein